jgi:hypothetical protein
LYVLIDKTSFDLIIKNECQVVATTLILLSLMNKVDVTFENFAGLIGVARLFIILGNTFTEAHILFVLTLSLIIILIVYISRFTYFSLVPLYRLMVYNNMAIGFRVFAAVLCCRCRLWSIVKACFGYCCCCCDSTGGSAKDSIKSFKDFENFENFRSTINLSKTSGRSLQNLSTDSSDEDVFNPGSSYVWNQPEGKTETFATTNFSNRKQRT